LSRWQLAELTAHFPRAGACPYVTGRPAGDFETIARRYAVAIRSRRAEEVAGRYHFRLLKYRRSGGSWPLRCGIRRPSALSM
jgi:hypothetical protein